MQPQHTHFVPPPIQTPSYVASSYDMPPDLIRDGEEGYASLPQSPLDFAFPPSITSGVMHPDPAAGLPQTICRSYVDENQMLPAPTCFNDGMNGMGLNVGASMLSGMSYVSSYFALVLVSYLIVDYSRLSTHNRPSRDVVPQIDIRAYSLKRSP